MYQLTGTNITARTLLAAASATAVLLGGCRHADEPSRVAGWSMIDPTQRHAIGVSREPEHLQVRVARGARGLTPAQKAQVAEFAAHARAADAGNTKIVVSAPAGADNEVEAAHGVEQIRYLLSDAGIGDASVGLEGYAADRLKSAPIRLSFYRYIARAPECGNWPTNLAREPQNIPYPNFGCSTQRNFANMVANPADLVEPRTETERSSERRDNVWRKYTKGAATGAQRGADERVSNSELKE